LHPCITLYASARVVAGVITTNQGGDRGRQGEGGAKVWARVLYEIANPESATKRFVLATVHGMNDGYVGGAGSVVTEDNIKSFARVSVTGAGQTYIATHIRDGVIARAEPVGWNVEPPAKGRSVREFVTESRAKELVPKWFN
jgi:hypothetical protein